MLEALGVRTLGEFAAPRAPAVSRDTPKAVNLGELASSTESRGLEPNRPGWRPRDQHERGRST